MLTCKIGRRLLFATTFVFFYLGCADPQATEFSSASISVDRPTVPRFLVSKLGQSNAVPVQFRIRNDSEMAFMIEIGDLSCSCLDAQLSAPTLLPKSSIMGEILVHGPFAPGEKHFGATLKANGVDGASQSIPIRASLQILNDIESRPSVIASELTSGQPEHLQRLNVITRSVASAEATSVLELSELPQGTRLLRIAKQATHAVASGILETEWIVELAFTLESEADSALGRVMFDFGDQRLLVPYSIRRSRGIRVMPAEISIRDIDGQKTCRRRFVLRAVDSVSFEITSIENKPDWVKISEAAVETAIVHIFEVSIDGQAFMESSEYGHGHQEFVLKMLTTHPEAKRVEVGLSMPSAVNPD